jgi:hypothetical protein
MARNSKSASSSKHAGLRGIADIQRRTFVRLCRRVSANEQDSDGRTHEFSGYVQPPEGNGIMLACSFSIRLRVHL